MVICASSPAGTALGSGVNADSGGETAGVGVGIKGAVDVGRRVGVLVGVRVGSKVGLVIAVAVGGRVESSGVDS